MSFKLAVAGKNAGCNGFIDRIDAGGAPGKIEFRTGSEPGVNAADTGTLLATLAFSAISFGEPVNGVATANPISSDLSVDVSGTPGYFRIKDSNNVVLGQGSVSATGGGGDITFDDTNWVAGGTVAISSMTITMPEV